MSFESVMLPNHLILCRPLLPLPSIFPSIRVFFNGRLSSSGGQSSGASASTSALPMNIQGWFPFSQFSSFTQLCPTLCDPMDCNSPGCPVHHQLLEFTQTHVHWVSDAIQPSHPLSSPSIPAFNLSQHQGLFQWVGFSHQVAKILELQLQHQSFQWIFRTDLL